MPNNNKKKGNKDCLGRALINDRFKKKKITKDSMVSYWIHI